MKNSKRTFSVIMCALMVFGFFCIAPVAGAAEKYSKGDVDGNGSITAADARLALRASVQLENLSIKAMAAADVNEDDYITASDARTILRVSVGLESFGATPVVPSEMPQTTAEICEFYKMGIDFVRAGNAGYTKKEWQNVDNVNVGSAVINNAVIGVLGNFMTSEADAAQQICPKGSEDAKRRIAPWTLTDLSNVASAKCEKAGDNYKITIIMKDEDNPERNSSFLGQVTNSVLYLEDIEATLKDDPTVSNILKEFSDLHIIYKGFKIEAVMTPDGKFISVHHTADVDIIIGYAKIVSIEIRDKSGHMWNYCKYYNFQY